MRISGLAAVSMIALLMGALPHVAAQPDLGAVGTDFEQDADGDGVADGWETPYGAAANALDVEFALDEGHDGGSSQMIRCTRYEDGHAMIAQVGTVAIERGEWYRATVWMRADGDVRVGVGIHDTDGWRQCGLWANVHPPSSWRRYSWRFQGDHDCHETSRLQIWFSSTGTLWVDDLTLERIEAPANANIIPDIGSHNLVPNSSFECGPDRWISAGNWRLFGEITDEDAVHGSRCIKLDWRREEAPVSSFDYYDPRRDPYTRPALTSDGWMRVQKGAEYVFSAWVRADRDIPNLHLHVAAPTGGAADRTVAIGREWTRVALPFAAPDDLCYVQLDVDCDAAELDQLVLWVDAVQVERGIEPTPWQPRRPIEIGLVADNTTGIFGPLQTPGATATIFNAGNQQATVDISCEGVDAFGNMALSGRIRQRPIPANSSVEIALPGPFAPDRFPSWMRLSVHGEQFDDRSVRIARIPDLDFEDSPFGLNHAYAWDPFVELARRLGITWVRDWTLKWDHVEPEPGQFDFSMADYQINRPLSLGANVLCMFPFPSAEWSSTAPPVEEMPDELTLRAGYRIRTAYAPKDPSELEDYVFECVRRYRDRIHVWEVFNESIFTSYSLPRAAGYEAVDYIPLLQRVHSGCKRADPDCLVIGGYSTPPGNFEGLHRPFIEAGGLEFCDLYSLHIYPGGEPEFIADQLDRIRDAMRDAGREMPMWMTEYAYYADDDPDPIPRGWPAFVESEMVQAQWNTRMCVLQLAHGVEKVFYHIWNARANRDTGARIFFEYAGAPRKIASSQAAMARMLGPEPRPLRSVDIGDDASCYVFGNRRGPDGDGPALVAVAWHHWGERRSQPIGDVEAFDLFGDPIRTEPLTLTSSPVFVIARGQSLVQFTSTLEEALQ